MTEVRRIPILVAYNYPDDGHNDFEFSEEWRKHVVSQNGDETWPERCMAGDAADVARMLSRWAEGERKRLRIGEFKSDGGQA